MTYLNKLLFLAVLTLIIDRACGQDFTLRSIDKTDSIAKVLEFDAEKLTKNELECHRLIWSLNEVRRSAIYLKQKKVDTFTMTDQKPTADSDYLVIGFYEMLVYNNIMDHSSRLGTYRVDRKMEIEIYNLAEDTWTSYK